MKQQRERPEEPARWLKVTVELHPSMEEAAVDYLVGVLGAGVEQSVEEDAGRVCLHVFLNEENPDQARQERLKNELQAYLHELAAIFNVSSPSFSWELIEDQDWSSNWKVHFKPFAIIPHLIIAPTWEEYQADEGERVITMDPGMAFGTGHHATTSLALAFVQQICAEKKGKQSVLDVGTGTGILGMGAVLFGAAEVLAIDNDPEAVRIAGENVLLNTLEGVMTVAETPVERITGSYTLIVANIIHDVLITMRDELTRLLVSSGDLVLSGILHGEQEKNIIHQYEKNGFRLRAREQREEWAALWFTKE